MTPGAADLTATAVKIKLRLGVTGLGFLYYLLADLGELGGGVGLLLARGGGEEHGEARERGQQARRRHWCEE